MAMDTKELVNLGLNIHQSTQIEKANKSNEKLQRSIKQFEKSNNEGHKTSQAMIAAGFVGIAKQNKRIETDLGKLHNSIKAVNDKVEENNNLIKNIDNQIGEFVQEQKRENAEASAARKRIEIAKDTKQIVFEMGQQVKIIKKNSNALERFIMYLVLSESKKMNSNIKVEIIDTIPGKEAFQETMDSIEDGMKESFEMISEKDVEKFSELHNKKESLNPMLPEYNAKLDELNIKIKEKKEIEDNLLKEKEQIEGKSLEASEKLKVEIEKARKEYGEKWYKQYNLNKKPKAKFLRIGLILSLIFFGPYIPQVQELIKNIKPELLEVEEIILQIRFFQFFSGLFLLAGIANWVRNNGVLDKTKKLESIIKKNNKEINSISEKGDKDLRQIKSTMTLLVEKLNSIIPEKITNEIDAMEKKIFDKYKNLEKYIDLDLLPSLIMTHKKE